MEIKLEKINSRHEEDLPVYNLEQPFGSISQNNLSTT